MQGIEMELAEFIGTSKVNKLLNDIENEEKGVSEFIYENYISNEFKQKQGVV